MRRPHLLGNLTNPPYPSQQINSITTTAVTSWPVRIRELALSQLVKRNKIDDETPEQF